MRVIDARNVNDAWAQARQIIMEEGKRDSSRNGPVLVHPDVVATVYTNPYECVLFDQIRDANPFFHLMEALWMLGGKQDAAFLNQFVKDFGARYAEASGDLWGAYGYRWRHQFEDDQLAEIIKKLSADPNDRRVVLAMWDPNTDLWAREVKDIPCNTHVYFRVVDGCLDMTVCCRSNDIVWGCYGANAVHFSFLQQYLAAMLGLVVGKYTQISNNWHAYYSSFAPLIVDYGRGGQLRPIENWYVEGSVARVYTLVDNAATFDQELQDFLNSPSADFEYSNRFFSKVARPMYIASQSGDRSEIERALSSMPIYNDWALAGRNWLKKRGRIE